MKTIKANMPLYLPTGRLVAKVTMTNCSLGAVIRRSMVPSLGPLLPCSSSDKKWSRRRCSHIQ
uniref:HDC02207 n=1 Tax=Drosophila melanogaster TaxID=7227 RepID=Q6IHM3_DROME|nr:TPA_inf: HDC02207 [Drosophila melanogaster]